MGNVPMVSFSGGEIGLEALARIDLDLYPTTGETFENAMPTMRGSLIKAPGSEYIGTVAASSAILRPFAFNVDQTRILEISDSEIRLVDDNDYVAITGAAATIGTPVDNASTGGSSVSVSGQNVTFTATTSGEAKAYWPITSGVNGSPTTFRFEVQRRPLKISVGTSTSAADILAEITLEPGTHILTITPTATTYYINVRLTEAGKAKLIGITRLSAGVLVIPTPWLEADLAGIRTEQSNDVVYFYHPDYRTRVLERRADASWSLRLFRPETGPFDTLNQTSTTITPSATSGSVTLSASAALFTSTSVGQLMELEHQGQSVEVNATAVDQASEPIRVFGVETNRTFTVQIAGTFVGTIKLQRSFGNTVDWVDYASYTSATTASITDDLDNQIVYYRLICSAYTSGTIEGDLRYSGGSTIGRAEIVEYSSPTAVYAEVYESFGNTTATSRWSEGAWSDVYGWPAAGLIYNSRHWLVRDDRLFVSVSDDYEDFEIGADAADAISRTFGAGDVNVARWIEVSSRVVVGTSGTEIEVGSNNLDDAITYLNIKADPAGDEGSANAQAVRAGKRVVYIDRTRSRLLQAYYDSDTGKIEIDDLCRLHEKIAGEIEQGSGDGFVEVSYQRAPEKRLWAVRSDGELATMLYVPREGIYGWSRWVAANDGLVKSVCVIPGTPEDRIHILVERVIDGSTVLYHERLSLFKFPLSIDADGNKSAPKAWRLQCALETVGSAATVFSGLDHLEGETVAVWADGRDGGRYTVESGAITISTAAERVIIGLEYEGRWKSSKLAYGARLGSALTQDKTVSRLGIVVHETPRGVVRYGRTFDVATDEIVMEFEDGFIMDAPVNLETEDVNQPFEGETNIDPRVCIVMRGPSPATILALVPNLDLEEW